MVGIFSFLGNSPPASTGVEASKRDTSLFDKLALQNTPEKELTHAGSKAGRASLSQGAPCGPEFERIRKLPRRVWQNEYNIPELIEQLSCEFRFDGGKDKTARLRPMQACALQELKTRGSLYLVASLGAGKTLTSGLAATALGFGVEETLYIQPARLVEKAKNEIARLYVSGWRVVPPKHIISAEELSVASKEKYLFELQPRVIIIDESQVFGNPKSGRSKRLEQYLSAAAESGLKVHVIPMTATPGDSTLGTVQHLMRWSLGAEHTPLPADKAEFFVWKMCLDADTGYDQATKKARRRPPPGRLVEFLEPGASPTLENVRQGVGKRIEETHSCFYYRTNDVDKQLTVTDIRFEGHSARLVQEFAAARAGDSLTDGSVIDVPVLDSVLFATLGLGFVRTLDPEPPASWRDARRAYQSLIREILETDSSGFCTPGQVALRFASGVLQDPSGAVAGWREIEPTFEVSRHTVWVDDNALRAVAALAAERKLIVWCAYPDFARKLATLTGMKYFANQGLAADGSAIEAYRPGQDGPDSCIASIAANCTGRNLQHQYNSNLVVGCPAKSDALNQLIGRTLRYGQQLDVDVRIFIASIESALALNKARERAAVDRALGRALYSPLLDCEYLVAPLADYVRAGDPVWSSQRSRLVDYEDD